MEFFAIIIYLAVFVAIIFYLDRKPQKPSFPEEVPSLDPNVLTERSFNWVKQGISQSFALNTTVKVRNRAIAEARESLINTDPSKIFMTSEDECFEIAESQIRHFEWGASGFEINQLAIYLKSVANAYILSDLEYAQVILSVTHEQCIPYKFDLDSTGHEEYFRYPIETIFDQEGDCDCKAILSCSLFKTLGFRVAIALMPGHAALAITLQNDDLPFSNFVWKGKKWFYCESTGDQWNPGILPDGINPSIVKLFEI